MKRNYPAADVHLRETLRDLLHGNLARRLLGPELVVVGVAIGLGANIAAL